ncbi:hypothetical protein GGX14DRAFT_422456 [Mycena pura]|uniref:Uncharacterized protein n=1 Tax=Mycena pura TaxID=153505 RepID=A0AAD6YPY0_9AGAR|nr:hypothetical protein GGX14DRAFT_422456 [Mycena pura]
MQPPFYILCAHSTSVPALPNPALVHTTVQYHYADDDPLAIVPHTGEQVLVLDYDSSDSNTSALPTVQSISPSVAVTNVRDEEAPGAAAAAADEGDLTRNDRMFIIETTAALDRFAPTKCPTRLLTAARPMDGSMGERKPAHAVLAQFKQRNAVLRRALLYPSSETPTPPVKPFATAE